MNNGYVVMSVPRSGLFVKDGQLICGNGTIPRIEELYLFNRSSDAEKLAEGAKRKHPGYDFPVVGCVVTERS